MSKIFKLFTALILFAGLNMVNAQVFITEITDPNNNAGGRYIELYNAGASEVDFTEGSNWRIDKYTNASATVSQTLNLTGTIPAGGFYIIATGVIDTDFLTLYGVDADQFDGADNNVAGSNGDDNLELYDGTGTLVDQFGVPGVDGTGTNHEFEDGRAERVATVTSGNPVWDVAEWNIDSDAPTGDGPQDAPGGFDPRVWPPVEITPIALSIFQIQYTDSTDGDSEYVDSVVTTTGVVTAITGTGFYMQDSAKSWNGIYVNSTTTVTLGDNVTVTGTVQESFGLTQITSVSDVTNNGAGVLPVALTVGTGVASAEMYESVLLTTTGTCDNADLGYGEWSINDGTGSVGFDDLIYVVTPTLGWDYTVTGPMTYSYSAFKILPRDANDVIETEVLPLTNDLNITFEDDSEVTKWSHFDEPNVYTTEVHDPTGGVAGSGALKLGDGGYAMFDKRKIYTTNGGYFTLSIDIKTQGWAVPETYKLFIDIQDFSAVAPIQINSDSGFTTFTMTGTAIADSGYIKITGGNTGGQNYIWIDNLVFDDDAVEPPPYYLAGDFQGWDPSSTPLFDDGTNGDQVSGDGIYSLEYSITTSGFHECKITNGTWDVTWPTANYWFSTTVDAQTVLFTFNANQVGDGWLPDQYILSTNEVKPIDLVAVGSFQSAEGETGDWVNNSTITAMNDAGIDGDWLAGDGIFCYHMTSLPTGTYSAKGVKTGEWNGWGADGRSVDAKNIDFTTTSANQDVYLYVNVNTGRSFLTFDAITPVALPKIFFSEYIEGTSNNKAIEIYNGEDTELDLTQFVILNGGNGGYWSSSHLFPANSKLASGDVWVIVADQLSATYYDTTKADEVIPYSPVSPVHYNGDDARAIAMIVGTDTTLIDVIGLVNGIDPGTAWNVGDTLNATANHTLVRKSTVTSGQTDWTLSAGTDNATSEWEIYPQNTFNYLGQHPGEAVVVITEPLVAAPTPTVDSSNVISLFSNAYNNAVVDTWSTSWDQADVADTQVVGNDTKLYTNLVYAGIETVAQVIDASKMTHFHMDIWTPDATEDPAAFKIKLVDFGADGVWGGAGSDDVEHEISITAATTPALATGEWVSIDLPLSDFTGLTTTSHMAQYIISGDPNTVYVDNMYFYKAPNPILFSNFESGLGDWTSVSVTSTKDWAQATGTGANGTGAFAQANGYGQDTLSNDYLIAGPFNLNNFTEEYMEFWSAAKYGKVDTELTLEYSTDYDGSANPEAFTWTELSFTLPVDLNDTWTFSGKVDLSTISSDVVYIAFHYLSNGTDIGRKKIDEVGIYGTPEQGVDLPPVIESVNRNVIIPDANASTEVTAVVSDDKGVANVNLIYSNDGVIFTSVAMSNTSGNNWVGSVPESLYNDGDLFGYYVEAIDIISQTDTSEIVMLFAGNTPIENIKRQTENGVLENPNVMAKVTGTVSAGTGTYSAGRIEAYIQDETAGVLVIAFGTVTPAMVENNSYTVTGKIIQYNGLIEIEPKTPDTDIIDNGADTALVPITATLSEINSNPEFYESRLVKVEFAELSSQTAWLSGNTSGSTMKIFVGTDTLDLRVDADTDIWGSESPEFPNDITGVLGQYDSSNPYNSGYQLMPRRLTDFEKSVGVDGENGIPTVYALSQNYPNPFNPSTKIKFSLPENGMVSLKIYDILGREVMTLINEELSASYQTVEFNASQLSSGIYFYRLKVNNFTSVKKMILMK